MLIKKLFFGFLILAFTPLSVLSKPADQIPFRLDVLETGTFEMPINIAQQPAPDAATGTISTYSVRPKLLVSTRTLQARVGAVFGFRYRITGLPKHSAIQLEMRVIHPAMQDSKGSLSTISSAQFDFSTEDGNYEDEAIYILSTPAEALSGSWVLQINFDGKLIVSREFTLN